MASKKQLVQSDIQINQSMSPVGSGFIGIGAKEKGLYELKHGGVEERILTTEDIDFTPENLDNKVSAFQITPDDIHYPSEKLVKDSLDKKENKNAVINNYYVTNLTELVDAWNAATSSTLPSTIYASGTITLLANLELFKYNTAKGVSIIGTPSVIFDLNNKMFTVYGMDFVNVTFRNPYNYNYIYLKDGYGSLKNVTFQNDSIDTTLGGTPVTHVTVAGNVYGGTGKLVIDGIMHSTNNSTSNQTLLIQPIIIKVSSAISFNNFYVNIKNVDIVSDFYRFSRVLISATISTTFKVTGDSSWFYAPQQTNPGTGFITSNSILNKVASIDQLYIGKMPNVDGNLKVLTVDTNNKVNVSNLTSGFIANAAAPTITYEGLRWLDLTTGIEYTWVKDQDTSQWVALNIPKSGGNTSGSYLPLEGGVLTGNLYGIDATFSGTLSADNINATHWSNQLRPTNFAESMYGGSTYEATIDLNTVLNIGESRFMEKTINGPIPDSGYVWNVAGGDMNDRGIQFFNQLGTSRMFAREMAIKTWKEFVFVEDKLYSPLNLLTTVKDKDFTLVLEDNGTKIDINNQNQNPDSITSIIIPNSSSVNFPKGAQIIFKQLGNRVYFDGNKNSVTIHSEGGKRFMRDQYAVCQLIYEGDDIWTLFGNLTTT